MRFGGAEKWRRAAVLGPHGFYISFCHSNRSASGLPACLRHRQRLALPITRRHALCLRQTAIWNMHYVHGEPDRAELACKSLSRRRGERSPQQYQSHQTGARLDGDPVAFLRAVESLSRRTDAAVAPFQRYGWHGRLFIFLFERLLDLQERDAIFSRRVSYRTYLADLPRLGGRHDPRDRRSWPHHDRIPVPHISPRARHGPI